MLETILVIAAVLIMVLGIIGCVVPGLPGPGFSFIALLLFQFAPEEYPFSWWVMAIFLLLTLFMIVLDYIGPPYATKKFGGTKYGVWGGIIGLIVGLIVPVPLGIIWGPLLGAIAGDLIAGKRWQHALKSGLGSFVGFVVITVAKLVVSTAMSVVLVLQLLVTYKDYLNPMDWFK